MAIYVNAPTHWEKFNQPILTSDTSAAPYFQVNCSSILNNNHLAYKAFDGNSTTYWHSASGHPSAIRWQTEKPLRVDRLTITNRTMNGAVINSYGIYWSEDGANWTLAMSGTSPNQNLGGTWTVDVTGHGAHRAWALQSNSSSGQNSSYSAVAEIKIDGYLYNEEEFNGPKEVKSIHIKSLVAKKKRFPAGSNLTEWVVPTGVTQLSVDCVASRGNAGTGGGGKGGRVQCKLNVTAGQTLYFTVGKIPDSPIVVTYNASDIRIGGTDYSNRKLVAGGGGSGGYSGSTVKGGDGGGLTGAAGQEGAYSYAGQGGTQDAGGAGGTNHVGGSQWNSPGGPGQFGLGGTSDNHSYHSQLGGIGGSGWYGGGGGAGVHTSNINSCSGGGGGSSYSDPNLCSDVVHTQGYTDGEGYIEIEILDDVVPTRPKDVVLVKKGRKTVYAKKIDIIGQDGGTVTNTNFWTGNGGSRYNGSATGTIAYNEAFFPGNYEMKTTKFIQGNVSYLTFVLTFNYTDGTSSEAFRQNFPRNGVDTQDWTITFDVPKKWSSYTASYSTGAGSATYCYAGVGTIHYLKLKEIKA